MKIGLTGSIACGKSTVSHYLRAQGYPVVDADAISHAMTAPGGPALPAIREAFGGSVFHPDGTLDRRALGSVVFSSTVLRRQLNEILHPMILAEIRSRLHTLDRDGHIVFGDIPLLFECGMEKDFDEIWVVSVSRETQIARLLERDGLMREEAKQRIDSQMPLAAKEERADTVIVTEGTLEDTQAQVRALLDHLEKRRQA